MWRPWKSNYPSRFCESGSPGKRGKPAICSRTSPPWHLGRRGANGVAVLIQWGNCFFVWTVLARNSTGRNFPGWKTSWIEIQSEGDILFIFRNCLLPQNHVLEYPSLTPYRDGYMRYSIKCFRILRCRCIPTFSCEKTALADIYLLDAPLLSLSRGIVAWGAAS